jgi:hypothetical protein
MIGSPVILSRSEAEAKNLLVGDAGRANRFDHGQFHRRSVPTILSAAKNLLVGDADRANRFERSQFHRGSFAALRIHRRRGTP